jgi:FAD/FMN-containing dehydrogenase
MTVDNLLSARVVTADGNVAVASDAENADLFWGIRGGGGNFGVVTSFEFRAHEVGPEVLAGLIVHPFADAPEVLRAYRDFLKDAPDEVTVWTVLRKAPPLPFLPEEVHGTEVVVLAAMYTGDMADGEAALAPLRAFGNPIADVIGPAPFAGWQQAFDPLLTPGERNYWKTHDFAELSDGLIDTALEYVATLPDPQCEVFFAQLGGAQGRVADDATAYQGRSAAYIMNVHGRWSDASQDDAGIGWCRDLWNATAQYATGEAYVNFMTEEEGERLESAYGSSFARLIELKNRYDPGNLFRMNQNIRPTV